MEVEARAVAAGSRLKILGVEYRLEPLTLQSLQEVQQAAFKSFKRDYLQTYQENISLLEPEQRVGLIERKLEEVARWAMSEMPSQRAYSAANCEITEAARKWAESKYESTDLSDMTIRNLLTTALDSKEIAPAAVALMCGTPPLTGMIPFDLWWATASREGMLTFVHASLLQTHKKITRETIASWPLVDLVIAAREIESLTKPVAGNM